VAEVVHGLAWLSVEEEQSWSFVQEKLVDEEGAKGVGINSD
jgi:hypothetical protein